MNNNNIKLINTNILCLFNKIMSKHHVINDRIHLECALVYLDNNYEESKFNFYYNYLLDKHNKEIQIFYLFNIFGYDIEGSSEIKSLNAHSILITYNISLDQFLGPYLSNDLDKSVTDRFTDILGKFAISEDKDLDNLYTRSIFVFKEVVWSTVVLQFKFLGIDISGGNTTNRHILNHLEFKLSFILLNLYSDSVTINNLLYNSKKNVLLKNNIPLDLYQKAITILENKINLLNIDSESYFETLQEKDFSNLGFHNIENYLIYNLYSAVLALKFNLETNLSKNLEALRNLVLAKEKECNELEIKINSITNCEPIVGSGSVKRRKLYKKLRTQMINDSNRINNLRELEIKLFNLKKEKENLSFKLKEKEEFFNNLEFNLKGKTFEEVNQLYNDSLDLGNSKQTKTYKNRFLKINSYFPLRKRNFTTYITKNLNKEGYTTLTDPIPVNNVTRLNNVTSQYFKIIEETLQNSKLNNEQKQEEIETLWVNIKKDFLENTDKSIHSLHSVLNTKLRKAEKTLELLYYKNKIKKNFPEGYEYLYDYNLILVTYMVCQESVIKNWNYTNTTRVVGNKILLNLYYKYVIGKVRNLSLIEKERKKEISKQNILDYSAFYKFLHIETNEDFIKLGNFFIDILMRYPSDIFEREFNNYHTKMGTVEVKLKYNEINHQEKLEQLIIEPFALPMLCTPNLWSETEYGGYLNNKHIKESIVSGSKHHNHKMLNKEALYLTINELSNTEFKINLDLLNYIIETKSKILQEEIFNGNVRDLITFTIAKVYSKNSFFLPVYVDWRGRIYVYSHYITYQGNDFSVSLLEFNKGEILTSEGLDNFYVYGANLYNENGISKKPFKERINWVIENKKKILDMDIDYILKAENKWTFIAFCLSMRRLEKEPDSLIYTPVFLDATCSGIQHLAAIIRDEDLGGEVNLIKQDESSIPGDIYSKLLIHINNEIKICASLQPSFAHLGEVVLTRKIVKKPIMTKTYNSTIIGMKDSICGSIESIYENKQLYYKLQDINGNTILVTDKDIIQIAKIIYNSIYIQYPGLKLIFDYFISMVKAFNQLNLPIQWVTPAGVKIIQFYNKTIQKKIAIFLGGETRKFVLQTPINTLDKHKQTAAFIPNIIHSLDAAHIMNLVLTTNKNKDFPLITVHDCFGSHPNNISNLNEVVLSEFIKLYTTHDFLNAFHKSNLNIFKSYDLEVVDILDKKKGGFNTVIISEEGKKVIIPKLPLLGKLNFNEVKQSKHFIT